MTRQIVLRSPTVNKRQPLLNSKSTSSTTSSSLSSSLSTSVRFAEVAGGTTAECAAIWCCCPCGLMNLLVLAVYKVPAGLCRRALRRKRRQRLIKKGLLSPKGFRLSSRIEDREEAMLHPITLSDLLEANKPAREVEMEVARLEKEMWERFYGTGFWRSPSQREY